MTGILRYVCSVLSVLLIFISAAHAENFVDNKDGTIFDAKSNLIWQQADDGTERAWDEAVKYCEDLELAGYTDWVLPKIFELEGLIDVSQSPTINPLFSVKPSYYWSSSESRSSVKSAKYVNFFYGNTYTYSKDNTYYGLCVRDASGDKAASLVADFKSDRGEDDSTVQFTAMISGGSEPFFLEWDFGDGDTSSLIDPSHSFPGPGTYTIKLTVSDSDGSIAVSSQTIALPLVDAVPEPVAADESVANKESREGQADDTVVESEAGAESTESAAESKPEESAAGNEDAAVLSPEVSMTGEESGFEDVLSSGHPLLSNDAAAADLSGDKEQENMQEEGLQTEAEKGAEATVDPEAITEETTLTGETDLSAVDDEDLGAVQSNGEKGDVEDLSEQDLTEPMEAPGIVSGEQESAPAPPTELLDEETSGTASLETAASDIMPVKVEKGTSDRAMMGKAVSSANRSVLHVFAEKEAASTDPGVLGYRLLAYAFSNALRGDADLNKDGKVTASELKGYLSIAMESLSEGRQTPVISLAGESFPLCSEQQNTFAFVIGVNAFSQGSDSWPYAAESAELVRKSIEEHCQQVQTISLSDEHASRQEVLQALMQIKHLIKPDDSLVFYYAGRSHVGSDGKLVLSLFDTSPEMASLTGLHYEDVLGFIKTMNTNRITLLLETAAPF